MLTAIFHRQYRTHNAPGIPSRVIFVYQVTGSTHDLKKLKTIMGDLYMVEDGAPTMASFLYHGKASPVKFLKRNRKLGIKPKVYIPQLPKFKLKQLAKQWEAPE